MISIGQIGSADEYGAQVYTAENVKLKINGNEILRPGKLELFESALTFRLYDANEGISIPWCRIGLHAIQNSSGFRSIYFMINADVAWPGVYENNIHNNGEANGQIDADDNDEGHESDVSEGGIITEFHVVPTSNALPTVVDEIFNAMKHCQSLHPDPEDSVSENDYMESSDEEAGAAAIRNLNLEDDEEKFADAEE